MKNFILALVFPTLLFSAQFVDPIRNIKFDYDETQWEVKDATPNTRGEDVDKSMAQKTVVNLQKKLSDDRYHARFSVVLDDASKMKKSSEDLFKTYQKHTVDFMKSQRFDVISVKAVSLPKVSEPAFEIMANQRDFGLLFRQVVFLKGETAYLLTAAARTKKYEEYAKDLNKIFESFEVSASANSR